MQRATENDFGVDPNWVGRVEGSSGLGSNVTAAYSAVAALPAMRNAGLAQNAIIRLLVSPVTLARGILQTTAVENRDIASFVADEALALQRSCGFGDADTTNAQHMPEEFLREMKFV